MDCSHNQRCRYTTGFLCEDCGEFFDKDSPTYRSDELLADIWMVLHNVWVNDDSALDALAMRDEIGIGKDHSADYEDLIERAEVIMSKYGKTRDSATITLR